MPDTTTGAALPRHPHRAVSPFLRPDDLEASADPVESLPERQFLVWVAKAAHRNMSRVAATLKISRETLYQELRRAESHVKPRWPSKRKPPLSQLPRGASSPRSNARPAVQDGAAT